MNRSYDAIIVGGGIVGASAAYHLARAGAKTLLVDRHDRGRATDAGAGILAPEMNRRDPDPWFEFAVPAVAYYPELVAALQAEEAGETSYARCGMLLVAATPDEVPAYTDAERHILARRQQRHEPPEHDLHPVSPGEARELFPALGQLHGALYYRNAARVDGRQLGQALRRAAERHGLDVLESSVERLTLDHGRVTGVIVDQERYSAATTVIAGGAWSAAFGAQLGVRIPVEPQRGQIAHLELPGQETGGWPIVGAFRGHYLVPWPNGRVAAGATRETGSGFQPTTTAAGVQEVLSEALRVAPGLAPARLLEVRVGLRPLPPDGLPVLGPVPGMDGVLLATGHGPTGLQLGPYSGKLMAELALGQTPAVDLAPFSVSRFRP
ncbi:MAG TPA: FAD-dependent oxidoreductase [Caldilineaceae bacterium]|nr:FAD-dependent oxidoreductase [Caldilineaceae bacterium]